jgi:hypothetical protein
MEQGWVYVLVNPSLPGLVKVGRTTRLPSTRVAELSQATGVATPFILVFEQAFVDCIAAERDIHAALDRCGMRVARNREFFRGPTTEIVRLVLQYAGASGDEGVSLAPQSGPELLQRGDEHLFGQGDALQNLPEALRCYQLAAARGSMVALERLGTIIAHTHGETRTGRARAAGFFEDGAHRGNYYCFCELGAAAAEDGNLVNFSRAWDLFFYHRQTRWQAEVEKGPERYPTALRRYVMTCLALGLRPGHLAELRAEADALIHILSESLDRDLTPPAAQRSLTVSLRWTKQVLMHLPGTRWDRTLLWGLLPKLAALFGDGAIGRRLGVSAWKAVLLNAFV